MNFDELKKQWDKQPEQERNHQNELNASLRIEQTP